MSRGIASFLILIVAIQQIICQDDFQNFVRTKLEKLETENTRLNEENTKLAKKVELYEKMSLESTSTLESIVTDYQNYKEKTTQEINICKEKFEDQGEILSELNHNLDGLQDVTTLLTTAKSCWQIGMQGITQSGEYNVDPDGSYSGGKPFSVQCSFPDNSTIIGEEVEIEIEKCQGEQCFEAQINYTMPVEQMKKLFAISGRCTQTLDFHCKLAPLQSRQGGQLFSYTDAQGIQHSLPGSNCNQYDPIWHQDSIEISDISSLPIQKINYGPLEYEEEKAKIVISAITCKPPPIETWPEHTIEGQVIVLKTEQDRFSDELMEIKDENVKDFQFLNLTLIELGGKVDILNQPITTTESPLPSQCHDYKSLTNAKRQSHSRDTVNYKCDKSGSATEAPDWMGAGWYRVEGGAGSKLSEDVNGKEYNCGTHIPYHMSGSHPALLGQTVTRTVCYYSACHRKREIEVTNCSSYYVYFLKGFNGCHYGYCTE